MASLEVGDLKRKFGNRTVLDGITFAVDEGKVFGYIGRNGSGKTTTINILSTLIPPSGGSVRVCGYDVVREPVEVRERIGVLFERFFIPQNSTPLFYIFYYGWVAGLPEPVIIERTQALMETFGILKYADQKFSELSEEVVRKAELCRTLISYPRVLMLDEPTRGLDIIEKKKIWGFLKGVSLEEKVAIFLASHDLQEINELCDDVAVISEGKAVYCGVIDEPRLENSSEELEKSLTSLMGGG